MNAAGNPRKILVNPKFKNKVVNQQPPVRLNSNVIVQINK